MKSHTGPWASLLLRAFGASVAHPEHQPARRELELKPDRGQLDGPRRFNNVEREIAWRYREQRDGQP